MTRVRFAVTVAVVTLLVSSPLQARADVVLDWNRIAVRTLLAQGQSPFAQARFMSITQLAVFEAVNSITQHYEPYPGTAIVASVGASVEAAAVTAAYRVLKTYFASNAALEADYVASMAAIPDGTAKVNGIAAGESAALKMTTLRASDGSAPAQFYMPVSAEPGVWQKTPGCPPAGGVNFQWQNITPFGVASEPGDQDWTEPFLPGPPPAITSSQYAKDYNEVKRVGGGVTNPERPDDRAVVVRFYAASSPSLVFNLAARQISAAQGRSLSENARALALLNMASNDALVASFFAKYYYQLWRPETAIRADSDNNPQTAPDFSFVPFILTPCFPSYPSNHASGSNSAAEVLRRLYGASGHTLIIENPAVPGVTLRYKSFKQITDDIDDARVYGGIHFRFDQDAGGRLGSDVAKYIYRNNLRPVGENQHGENQQGGNRQGGKQQ
jgi:hypothetical protein